jgi:hypothetical protein
LLESNTYERGVGKLKFSGIVEIIPIQAFSYEKKLTRVAFGKGVKEIKNSAFFMCTALERCVIPESVNLMSDSIFAGCYAMNKFEGKYASEDGKYIIADGMLTAYLPSASEKEFTVPESVNTIGAYTFYHCNNLETVNIPETVTAIEQSAFLGCTSLKKVNVPSKVKKLYDMFRGCTSLTDVTLNEGLELLDYEVFSDCKSLETIYIPSTVTEIRSGTFYNCSNLKRIIFKGNTPPIIYSPIVNEYTNVNCRLYVPDLYYGVYTSKDANWESHYNYIIPFDYKKGVSAFDYRTHRDFNFYQSLLYVTNKYEYSSGKHDYRYASTIPTYVPSSVKHSAVEMRFKVNTTASDKEVYNLTAYGADEDDDDYGTLLLSKDGISYSDDYLYTWSEMGVAINDVIRLFISFKDQIFQVNGKTLEWKFNGVKNISIDRFFGDYIDYYDDGDYEDLYYGFPDGSKLYYAMTWDEFGTPIYFGYSSKSNNPQTSKEEYCWKGYYNGEYKYDFAYYHYNISSSRQPYGVEND